ncbi:MAG TPA: hypothetical protein VMH39_08955 [Gemmatimonadaceae bacterium]|nr:hypothetical protein [Gemmatimonadaceae bacterium]
MSNTAGVGTVLPWEWSENPSGSAPYTYTVPASLEVMPYTSTAVFDGSGAAGDFVPTLSLYSQTGGLLARVFPSTKVTAGDTATVTWVPPFGSAASSPTPSGGNTFSSFMEVELGWAASGSPGDSVIVGLSLLYGDVLSGVTRYNTMCVVLEGTAGGDITFAGTNADPVNTWFIDEVKGAFQDLASSTHQTFLNTPSQYVAPSTTSDFAFDNVGHVGALVDTTTTPATWIADGRYACTLTFAG